MPFTIKEKTRHTSQATCQAGSQGYHEMGSGQLNGTIRYRKRALDPKNGQDDQGSAAKILR